MLEVCIWSSPIGSWSQETVANLLIKWDLRDLVNRCAEILRGHAMSINRLRTRAINMATSPQARWSSGGDLTALGPRAMVMSCFFPVSYFLRLEYSSCSHR